MGSGQCPTVHTHWIKICCSDHSSSARFAVSAGVGFAARYFRSINDELDNLSYYLSFSLMLQDNRIYIYSELQILRGRIEPDDA